MAPQHNDEHSFSSEIDRLLPLNERIRIYPIRNRHHALRWLILVASSAAALAAIALSSYAHAKFRHKYDLGQPHPKLTPSKQIHSLNDLTTTNINAVTKKKYYSANSQVPQQPTYSKTTICTTQLIIMRHCEKRTKAKGQRKKIDTIDELGNRHCSAEGKKRSEYIATLFVDSNEREATMDKNDISTNFNSPQKLYALSQVRYKHHEKDHKNYREVETLLPTATKFHLSMDDRFGVGDEGGLASDYFKILSKSVADRVDANLRNATNAIDIGDYCNNGMVVVNWKHSRIPKLSRALGCGKKQGCPKIYSSDDFDTVWLLTYQYSIEVRNENDISRRKSSDRQYLKNLPFPAQGYWNVSVQLINEGF